MRLGQNSGRWSIGIVESRVSRKERAEESGFIERRNSYRTIRFEERRKVRITKVVGDIFG